MEFPEFRHTISPSTVSFLNNHFRTDQDLLHATHLSSQLQSQCLLLDQRLLDLNQTLQSGFMSYSSFSEKFKLLFSNLSLQLSHLNSITLDSGLLPSDGLAKTDQILGEELPALAKEVARVEAIRIYTETVLKLDTFVGEIEDAVSSTMKKNLVKHSSSQNSKELHVAIRSLKLIEDVLTSVTKTHPNWNRLVSAVDHRVDRALAILRPQAIANHRALLSSLGWPPPLSTLNSSDVDARKSAEITNPLFTLRGDLKHQYCDNFLALCGFQEVQKKRKSRQLEGCNHQIYLHQALWTIEELVNPISIACESHFSKWVDKPEFIFALVYKITKDYVDSMDELLQPLVDEAMLVGYSCKEEWISSMVSSLSTYLAKEIFPIFVGQLDEHDTETYCQARISWLHLVDLMTSFDKRVQSLVAHSGTFVSLQVDGNLQKISSLSVFCDRTDWLDLWAEIELSDALDKLKPEMDDERKWITKAKGGGSESYKSPAISDVVLKLLRSVVDRCRSLPNIPLRSRFVRLTGGSILRKVFDCLLLRCQETEGLTALAGNDALIKVCNSINAAHYFESVLNEWCDDVFFLELSDQLDTTSFMGDSFSSSIFYEEIENLEEFRREWVEKLSGVVLRGFNAECQDYMRNKKQWQEKGEGVKSFIGALEFLQGRCCVLEDSLNKIDFVGVWRALACGADRMIFNGVLMSSVKFYDGGKSFEVGMEGLFSVFGSWCLRPESFFPKVREGLKLLRMAENDLECGLDKKWLKDNRIGHLSVGEVQHIAKHRIFG